MVQNIHIVKYREIPNKFCLTSRLLLKILLIIKVAIIILNIIGYSIYVFNIPQYVITFVYDIILVVLGICSFSLVKKYKYALMSIVAGILIIAYGNNLMFYNENTEYTTYISPDNDTTIVTKSSGYLFSGKTKFYTKTGIVLKDTKNIIELDEGYQQIRNAKIDVTWTENETIFNYTNDLNEIVSTVTIEN